MEHGSLKLNAKAFDVFRGEKVYGTLPDQPRRVSSIGPREEYDRPLFERLRRKRKTLADEAGVPPYVIFSDRSLAEMATYFPQSRITFGDIYGVGDAKLNSYADEFLPIIQEYCQENGIEPKSRGSAVVQVVSARRTRTDEVLDLYNSGLSISEISDKFGSKERTVLNHLWKAYVAGKELQSRDLRPHSGLTAEQQEQVLAAFKELGADYLRPIYDAMNGTVHYDELGLLRLHFVSQ
jgi:ATP-dependent DNA helicase RecQ